MELVNEESQLLLQRILGQTLFYPPNVAGWPGGKSWIDSSTLMMRMRLPKLFTDVDEFNVQPKSDDDQMMGMEKNKPAVRGMGRAGQSIKADINWEDYLKNFESIPRERLLNELSLSLLQLEPGYKAELIKNYSDSNSRESFLKTATIQIMSTPEYQMC